MTTEKIKNNYNDDVRLALLEQSIININDTLVRFEKRFDKIDEKFTKIDEKFDRVDNKFDRIEDRFDKIHDQIKSETRWIITVFGGLMLGLSGLMAHGFHWI